MEQARLRLATFQFFSWGIGAEPTHDGHGAVYLSGNSELQSRMVVRSQPSWCLRGFAAACGFVPGLGVLPFQIRLPTGFQVRRALGTTSKCPSPSVTIYTASAAAVYVLLCSTRV